MVGAVVDGVVGGPFDDARPARRPRLRAPVLLAVFAGGCAGGLARYEVTQAWPTPGGQFPWSTFVVNVTGAFALAVLLVVLLDVLPPTTYVRPAVGTGLLGAWTTYSAVAVAGDLLIAHGHAVVGVVYAATSALGGLFAAVAGLALGRAAAARRRPPRPSGGT